MNHPPEAMMEYPETVNLPFNSDVLGGDFAPCARQEDDDPTSGYLVMLQGGRMVVRREGASVVLHHGPVPEWGGDCCLVRIGTWKGEPLRAARISRGIEVPAPYLAEEFNAGGDVLDDALLTLGGIAQQVLYWQKTSAFCPLCGAATGQFPGTWGKRCTACGEEGFPRIHPCVIVLVRRGEEFLLGRKSVWSPGRYGLIAGFVDFGECLEETVRREVREETGLEVTDIRYVGSQAWPFPSQLMMGFVARHESGEIDVSGDELESACWFTKERLPASLPPKRSIARWIIDRFALECRP